MKCKNCKKLEKENHPHHDKVITYWKSENFVLKELLSQFSPLTKEGGK